MQKITDEFMKQMLPKAKQYVICILKAGPKRNQSGVEKIIWEHGRRNFALRADGVLSIVCPVIEAEVFVYELHTCRSFPGDSLPK